MASSALLLVDAAPGPGVAYKRSSSICHFEWRTQCTWRDHCFPFVQVQTLSNHRITDIACGSRDAQSLALSDDDTVWSWGDGDYGKLGRGGSDGCKIPMKIDSLAGLGVVKVECGSQFSVALTRSGVLKFSLCQIHSI